MVVEVGLRGPVGHLAGAEEEAAGVRVQGAGESDFRSEGLGDERGAAVDVLKRRRRPRTQIAVDVYLRHEMADAAFEAVRLEQLIIVAGDAVEPRQLAEEPRRSEERRVGNEC